MSETTTTTKDLGAVSVSRTVGQNRVIDELIVSFTHDREMRVFLPGVAPTGRKVVLPHVVVMGFDDAGRVAYEHIYGSGIAARAGRATRFEIASRIRRGASPPAARSQASCE